METSLMSESVVDAADVEETVTQVLTQFVQGGREQTTMSVQLLQEQVEIQLGYDQRSLNKWHNFLRHPFRFFDFSGVSGPILFYFSGSAGPIFCFLPVLTFCLAYYQR